MRTLPKEEWTHGAHLTAAVTLLTKIGVEQAISEMPGLIRCYNKSVGGVNSDTEGYHHTITVFYLKLISAFCAHCSHRTVGDQATALLGSPLAERDFPLQCYSKDLLFSVEARRHWHPPDLTDLPFAEIASAEGVNN